MRGVSQYNRDMVAKDDQFSLVEPVFWDVDCQTLSWDQHRDFIIQRILESGSMEMLRWLQQTVGADALRGWLQEQQGAGLSPRRLRFWQLILNLPEEDVSAWIEGQAQSIWWRRVE